MYYLIMVPNLPNIFSYTDFRLYLDDYQRARFTIDRSFSRSALCRMLGLPNSRSFFRSVINGQKISRTFVDRFIRILELDSDEAKYFGVLVKFNQAETIEEREMYFDQLISLNRTPMKVLTRGSYEYYRKGYNSIIRALLAIHDFSDNYRQLAKMVFPPITEKNARDSIRLLKKLELIRKNDKGFYKPTDKSISTPPLVKDEIVKQFQLQCLEMAKLALLKNNLDPQSITTNILYVSEEALKHITDRIERLRSEVRAIAFKDTIPADRVYQLDILLFPNTMQKEPAKK